MYKYEQLMGAYFCWTLTENFRINADVKKSSRLFRFSGLYILHTIVMCLLRHRTDWLSRDRRPFLSSKFYMIYCLRYFQHTLFIPKVGMGRERHTLIGPWYAKAAPFTGTTLRTTGPVPADSRLLTSSVRNYVTL